MSRNQLRRPTVRTTPRITDNLLFAVLVSVLASALGTTVVSTAAARGTGNGSPRWSAQDRTTLRSLSLTSLGPVPADPSNMNAQALRIESQPGTGFERGIVLARHSLHASRVEARPILVDLREVPADSIAGWDLVACPDGCRLRYAGRGRLATTC